MLLGKEVIQKRALQVKKSENTAEIISWRYNLDLHQVKAWLSQTEWKNNDENLTEIIEKVVIYLKKLDLLSHSESKNWSSKLFI